MSDGILKVKQLNEINTHVEIFNEKGWETRTGEKMGFIWSWNLYSVEKNLTLNFSNKNKVLEDMVFRMSLAYNQKEFKLNKKYFDAAQIFLAIMGYMN